MHYRSIIPEWQDSDSGPPARALQKGIRQKRALLNEDRATLDLLRNALRFRIPEATGPVRMIYQGGELLEVNGLLQLERAILVGQEGFINPKEPEARSAYNLLGRYYCFLEKRLGINSYDNNGAVLCAAVHSECKNALWDGYQVHISTRVGANSRTGIFHELSHGLVQSHNPQSNIGEAGGVDEHLADTFALAATHFYDGRGFEDSIWGIGEDFANSPAVRSFRNPNSIANQPTRLSDLGAGETRQHFFCNIPNAAFYQFCGCLQENASGRALDVWWCSLLRKHSYTTSITEWANLTLETAIRKFGRESKEVESLKYAWGTVGVNLDA